jgi:hypothetical protein
MWGLWDISDDLLNIHWLFSFEPWEKTGAFSLSEALRLATFNFIGWFIDPAVLFGLASGHRADVGLIVLSSVTSKSRRGGIIWARSSFKIE